LTHVTVIDATGAPAATDMTVVISGDRISKIGKTREVPIPERAQLIDGTGKFLIPGLWDMHVHLLCKERVEAFFPLLIANGVTGIRDMGSPFEEFEQIKQWRKAIDGQIMLGPRIVACGPIVDGANPVFPDYSFAARNEMEGRQIVDLLKRGGADFVKVYSLLTRDTYFAIADEARLQGIPFAGHVPESVSAVEASDAGQRSIEHLSGIRLACSTNEAELRKQLLEARAKSDPSLLYQAIVQSQEKAAATFSQDKAEALFSSFVKNGTWQVPTLVVSWAIASATGSSVRLNPLTANQERKPNGGFLLKDITAESLSVTRAGPQKTFELVDAMRRAGVEFMAGTDAPNPWILPGSSLHEELSLLVIAGLTPMEALQAATRNPAKYLGLIDRLGTIEEGKIADLILLEANPLEEISNTRRIWAVAVRGKLIFKPELKQLESKARDAISKSSRGPLSTTDEELP
jgi:imidazolonepropionase-like amidohydrolase